MNKILKYIIFSCICYCNMWGQQGPHYSQYMYNMNIMNPAYAGSKEDVVSLALLYRKQWVGMEGAPTTQTFSGHTPIGHNLGLGLSFINDEIGPITEQNAYADISYTISLGKSRKLAFGVKVGGTFHNVDLFGKVYDYVPDIDDYFGQNKSVANMNFGAGVFYYTNKGYFAFSIPNLSKSYHLDYNGIKYGTAALHYFITGGYVFDINKDVKLKPFAMIKSAINTPVSMDLSLNALIHNKLELGVSYRLKDSFSGVVNFSITPDLRIGYAYDRTISDLKIATVSSHEFILLYDFGKRKNVHQSSRFF